MSYQRWSALTASSYNKIYRQNPPTTKAWNVDTVLKKRSQSQGDTAIHNFPYCTSCRIHPKSCSIASLLYATTNDSFDVRWERQSKSRKYLLNKGGG